MRSKLWRPGANKLRCSSYNKPLIYFGFRRALSQDIVEKRRAFWRREWDSNPRYGFPYTRFPSVRLQPLGHPSARGRAPQGCAPQRCAHYSRGRRGGNPFAAAGHGPITARWRLSVHQPHRASLADVVAAKLGGALAEGGRAHEAEQRL